MKSIARSAILTLLFLAGVNLAFSQDTRPEGGPGRTPPDATQMADRQTERLSKTVQLSDAQRQQVQAINLKYAQQHQQNRAKAPARDGNPPTEAERKAMHDQMKASRDQQDAELKAVLTPEQWAAWEKERAEHHGKHGKGKKTKKA